MGNETFDQPGAGADSPAAGAVAVLATRRVIDADLRVVTVLAANGGAAADGAIRFRLPKGADTRLERKYWARNYYFSWVT